MRRVRIVKKTGKYGVGEVVVVDNNVAFGLIDSGSAVISKDMTPDDYKQAGDKNGKFTQLRPMHSRRR